MRGQHAVVAQFESNRLTAIATHDLSRGGAITVAFVREVHDVVAVTRWCEGWLVHCSLPFTGPFKIPIRTAPATESCAGGDTSQFRGR